MYEVLRDLVVSLSLKTDNFSRHINSILNAPEFNDSFYRHIQSLACLHQHILADRFVVLQLL